MKMNQSESEKMEYESRRGRRGNGSETDSWHHPAESVAGERSLKERKGREERDHWLGKRGEEKGKERSQFLGKEKWRGKETRGGRKKDREE